MTTIASHQQAPSEQLDFFGIPDELQTKTKPAPISKPPPLRIEVLWNGGVSPTSAEEQAPAEALLKRIHPAPKPRKRNLRTAYRWPDPKDDNIRSTLTVMAESDNGGKGEANVSFDDLDVEVFDSGSHVSALQATGNEYSTGEYKTMEEFLAGLMLKRMKYDLNYAVKQCDDPYDGNDFSGTTMLNTVQHDPRILARIDAVVWLFDLHTESPQMSVNLCCALLYMDVEPIRRIVARNCRHAIEQAIALLADVMGKDYASRCAAKVSEYLTINV